jgi:hypothetical protein
VKQLGPADVRDVFAEWGVHEAEGRCVGDGTLPRGFLDEFSGAQRHLQATAVILQKRWPVIAAILAANPVEWVSVEVSKADLPSILVMGGNPLTTFSRDKLAERGPSADYVRRLATGPDDITGPMLAIGPACRRAADAVRRHAPDGRLGGAPRCRARVPDDRDGRGDHGRRAEVGTAGVIFCAGPLPIRANDAASTHPEQRKFFYAVCPLSIGPAGRR